MDGDRVAIEDVKRLPIFGQIEDRDLSLIAHGLERESFAAGDFIFRQGDPADSALFIAEGEVEIMTRLPGGDEVVVATVAAGGMVGEASLLEGGGMIGETSLLEGGARTASVRCARAVTGFRMDRRFFRASIAQHDVAAFCIMRQIMRIMAARLDNLNRQIVQLAASSMLHPPRPQPLARRSQELEHPPTFNSRAFMPILSFFREFREADIDALAARAQLFTLPNGITLFEEGDESTSLFIVLRGALSLYCIDDGGFYPIGIVGPGKVCGADDLIVSRPRASGCLSSSEVTLLEIPAAEFNALIGDRSWLSFRFEAALCNAQLESLARANRRLSHEIIHTSMMEHRAIARLVPPRGQAAS